MPKPRILNPKQRCGHCPNSEICIGATRVWKAILKFAFGATGFGRRENSLRVANASKERGRNVLTMGWPREAKLRESRAAVQKLHPPSAASSTPTIANAQLANAQLAIT